MKSAPTMPRAHCAPSDDVADFRALQGDGPQAEAAFSRVYERFYGRVLGYAAKRLRSHDAAEEVTQEAGNLPRRRILPEATPELRDQIRRDGEKAIARAIKEAERA